MRLSRTKKAFGLLILATVTLLLVCHYRVPFFKQSVGYWSVGYGRSDRFPETMKIDPANIFSIAKLKQVDSTSEFLADPFFVTDNGKHYIFFEHKHTTYHPAEIGLLESTDGLHYSYKGSVLRETFHLSYPQVFKYRGNYYMLPESQAANQVLLYKAENFPFGWKVCDTILANTKFKDPSIYLSDTLNVLAVADKNMNMYLYRADSLFGKWTPYDRKVLIGGEARPGGRFFNDGKGLVLPVQNSSKSYGSGLSLYRLNFKNNSFTVKREKPLFLQGQPTIPEFAAGMHQFDIQKTGDHYYYVYDGISLRNKRGSQNIYSSLKTNSYDLWNWFYQLAHN